MADKKLENGVIDGKSKNRNLNAIVIIVFSILIIYTLFMFILLGWGLLTSFKTTVDFKNAKNVLGWPNYSTGVADVSKYKFYNGMSKFRLITYNYTNVFRIMETKLSGRKYFSALWNTKISTTGGTVYWYNYLINSIVYAVICSVIQVVTCMTTAYLCCKYKYKFSYFIYAMLLVVMAIPVIGSNVSTVQVLYDLGIFDSYFAMFIMSANMSGMYFFVYFAFFQGLSDTYIEAAEIDGSSQFMTYIRIVLPLSMNMAGTVILISFITLWNNYEVPLMYYPTKPTLAYAIYYMNQNTLHIENQFYRQDIPQRIAGCMTLAIPMIILFVALKDKILGNLSMGGLKE